MTQIMELVLYAKPTALAAFRRPVLSIRRGSTDPSITLQNHRRKFLASEVKQIALNIKKPEILRIYVVLN